MRRKARRARQTKSREIAKRTQAGDAEAHRPVAIEGDGQSQPGHAHRARAVSAVFGEILLGLRAAFPRHHVQAVEAAGTSRILQLWIALPAHARGVTPSFELVRAAQAPVIRAPGVEARLYSGVSGPLRSATKNIVPITLVDVRLEASATFTQELSTSYNGFVYVLDGDVEIGGETLRRGEVGWFAPGASTSLVSRADARGARFVLYAGMPTRDALIQHGPFVAGSAVEIRELYRRFRSGDFISMSHLARMQRAEGATNDDDLLDASASRP